MSKISLKPNASGTGVFSLEAPDSNTDRTLTLPDEEGTVATIENIPPGYEDQDALDLFNVTGSAPVYACRAWVQFDGAGTVSISGSGNVSSITDNGTGNYTVNFTTAMPDENSAALADGSPIAANKNFVVGIRGITTTGFDVFREDSNGNAADDNNLTAAVFR